MEILSKPLSLMTLFVLAILCHNLSYAEVLIFTDEKHPISNAGHYEVYYLDLPAKVEQRLSEGLSNDPTEAKQQALQRINDPKLQQEIQQSYRGVIKAWQLGLTKIPAVVVNGKYVVYGIADVKTAVNLINQQAKQD